MEKYPKLKIGLDYESFTFDEFSEKDPELILRLHSSRFFCLGVVKFYYAYLRTIFAYSVGVIPDTRLKTVVKY